MLDKLKEKGFEIHFESHAAAILEKDFPTALTDIEQALSTLTIPIAEIIGSGGGETKGTQRMRRAFSDLVQWKKVNFEIEKIINGVEREARSHEMDHAKKFGDHTLALEIEWNNKDPFFDRDLDNSVVPSDGGRRALTTAPLNQATHLNQTRQSSCRCSKLHR